MNAARFEGFRVAIIGGCQVLGLKVAIERFLPGCHVDAWHVSVNEESMPDKIAPRLSGADLVVTQLQPGDGGPLDIDALRMRHSSVVFLPLIVFTGFHPDSIFCTTAGSPPVPVKGPLDILQSEIVLAGFHLGLPARRVSLLFNPLVLEELGYAASFQAAKHAFLNIFRAEGYDLSASFDEWMKLGTFMYTDNHPRPCVLTTLARMAVEKAGLTPAVVSEDETWPDYLSGAVRWPVYPAIARRLGIEGSTDFMKSVNHAGNERDRVLPVDAFVEASYEVLEHVSRTEGLSFLPRTLDAARSLQDLLDIRAEVTS